MAATAVDVRRAMTTERIDLARHHAFEVSVWRTRHTLEALDAPPPRSWGWTVRIGGAIADQCEEDRTGQLCANADEAFECGTQRLLAILRNRAAIAADDLHLVQTGLGVVEAPAR